MTPKRWQEINAHLDRLFDLPDEEREAHLRELREEDEALHDEVAALLKADAEAGVLDEPLEAEMLGREEPVAPTREGERVGPYRLTERIGVGGMGTVYRAERADGQFRQEVALKMVRHGVDREDVLRRFRTERQILAQLDHPNIARLLDGGVSADGQPYLVMEFVDGVPIDTYCREKACTLEERLALFETVVRAVQHAHQHLVIHRDLKPGNILVTSDGTVKLLDFGIAKLLDETSVEATVPVTRTGMQVMTTEYAAPEQVKGEGISTSTDIYQLGLVLYELLTGERAFDFSEKHVIEKHRTILEEEPAAPSTRVTGSTELPETPAIWRSELRGDLDLIVLKSLRKERERRYASASALADDIERFTKGLPIQARPDSWRYRTSKYVRRHRVGIATAALVVLLLVGMSVVYALRITEERDRARMEAAKAQQVTDFLLNVFREADPAVAQGDELTAREILEQADSRLETELAAQPELRAEMMQMIAEVEGGLGLYEEAVDSYAEAIQLRWSTPSLADTNLIRLLNDRAVAYFEMGENEEAMAQLRMADSLAREMDLATAPLRSSTLNNLALYHRREGALEKADSLYRLSIALQREAEAGPTDVHLAALQNLAHLEEYREDYDAADSLYRHAIELGRTRSEGYDVYYGNLRNKYANFLKEIGRYEEALVIYSDLLAEARRVLPPGHDDIARQANNLATLYNSLGRSEEAIPLMRESLEIRMASGDSARRAVATGLINLAATLRRVGEYDEAERMNRRALNLVIQREGEESDYAAITLYNLGSLQYRKGDLEAARQTLERSMGIHRRLFGPQSMRVGIHAGRLVRVYRELGERRQARQTLEKALGIFAAKLDSTHRRIITLREEEAILDVMAGRYARAEETIEQIRPHLVDRVDEDGWQVVRMDLVRALAEWKQGEASSEEVRSLYARLADQLPEGDMIARAAADLIRGQGLSL